MTERRGHILKECMKFLEKQDGQILKLATEAGPSAQQAIVSDSLWTNDDKKKRCNKRKIEAVLNDYISDMKEERTEKEKKKQAKEVLKKLGKQREKQHKEKIAIMQQFLEAITKK